MSMIINSGKVHDSKVRSGDVEKIHFQLWLENFTQKNIKDFFSGEFRNYEAEVGQLDHCICIFYAASVSSISQFLYLFLRTP